MSKTTRIFSGMYFLLLLTILGCGNAQSKHSSQPPISEKVEVSPSFPWDSLPPCDGFDYPVGPPNGKGYYDAQPFGKNTHLGCDWNGVRGGNSDLGDGVFAIADGYITYAENAGPGWGNVVRIIHNSGTKATPQFVESLYGHLDTILVQPATNIRRGDSLGTIGNADGIYYAHLHLEIRDSINMELGGGYHPDTTGFTDPTAFIRGRRPPRK